MNTNNEPIILSFDVGIINLSYCLLTKKDNKWEIIEWNNIDLTNSINYKCECGAKSSFTHKVNNIDKYYCKNHCKNIEQTNILFDNYFKICQHKNNKCCHKINSKDVDKLCNKNANYDYNDSYFCTVHAKQLYKNNNRDIELKSFKIKKSTSLLFDDVKYNLILELEKRKSLLNAEYVVIENQPAFKNPRMKSIASTLYDYYLIRGIIDKNNTKSSIKQVKFISPSNKLKLANCKDAQDMIDSKKISDSKSYKLNKTLSIKYCFELITHLEEWTNYLKNNKKKDDLADSFLQGIYYYNQK